MEALSRICSSVTLHLVPRSPLREARHLARSIWTGLPLTVERHYSSGVMTRVAEDCRARRIEVVYCDHLSMLEYGRRVTLPIVHDAHNIEHRIMQRYAESLPRRDPRRVLFRRETRLLRAYEQRLYPRCSLIFAVSEVDASTLATFAPNVPLVPVPIAVAAATLASADPLADEPEVLFVGAQDWPPNRDAVDYFIGDIWPLVRSRVPRARLTVVGRGEEPMKRRWPDPSVRFTGWVEHVGPWFQQSRVMVVPLRSGSGMRVKILDAFARGVPVVATAVGIEGIAAVAGEHALVADTPEAFAAATVRVLQDGRLARQLSLAAGELVRAQHDTKVVAERQLASLRTVAQHV
jgi:glycosyltransferase involved in cell wall biosynthesis